MCVSLLWEWCVCVQRLLSKCGRKRKKIMLRPPDVDGFAPVAAAINRLFDEAFGGVAAEHDMPTARAADDADDIVFSPVALTVRYSQRTADWLTEVTNNPEDFGLVYDTCLNILTPGGEYTHPLDSLTLGFVRLFGELFHGAATEGTDDSAFSSAIAALRMGTARLLAIALEVFPQLRESAAIVAAKAAVEEALWKGGCDAKLRQLVAASRDEPIHDAFASHLDGLAEDLSSCGGAAECALVDPTNSAGPYNAAVVAARRMHCVFSPRAKLRCFLLACEEAARCEMSDGDGSSEGESGRAPSMDGWLSTGADDLIPIMGYVLVCARLRELPAQLRVIEAYLEDDPGLLGPLGYSLATLHAATRVVSQEGGTAIQGVLLRWASRVPPSKRVVASTVSCTEAITEGLSSLSCSLRRGDSANSTPDAESPSLARPSTHRIMRQVSPVSSPSRLPLTSRGDSPMRRRRRQRLPDSPTAATTTEVENNPCGWDAAPADEPPRSPAATGSATARRAARKKQWGSPGASINHTEVLSTSNAARAPPSMHTVRCDVQSES